MAKSLAKARADYKFNRKTYDIMAARLHSNDVLSRELVKQCALKKKMSINSFVILAIKEAIERDRQAAEVIRAIDEVPKG